MTNWAHKIRERYLHKSNMVIAVKPKIVNKIYGTIQRKKIVNHGTTILCPNGTVLSHSFHDDVSDQCLLRRVKQCLGESLINLTPFCTTNLAVQFVHAPLSH